MRGWVVVTDHPYYALTNEEGQFVLQNVPPGNYTLQVWQESLGTLSREITVSKGGANSVILEMQKKSSPAK
jgi:hypothetical protein